MSGIRANGSQSIRAVSRLSEKAEKQNWVHDSAKRAQHIGAQFFDKVFNQFPADQPSLWKWDVHRPNGGGHLQRSRRLRTRQPRGNFAFDKQINCPNKPVSRAACKVAAVPRDKVTPVTLWRVPIVLVQRQGRLFLKALGISLDKSRRLRFGGPATHVVNTRWPQASQSRRCNRYARR